MSYSAQTWHLKSRWLEWSETAPAILSKRCHDICTKLNVWTNLRLCCVKWGEETHNSEPAPLSPVRGLNHGHGLKAPTSTLPLRDTIFGLNYAASCVYDAVFLSCVRGVRPTPSTVSSIVRSRRCSTCILTKSCRTSSPYDWKKRDVSLLYATQYHWCIFPLNRRLISPYILLFAATNGQPIN